MAIFQSAMHYEWEVITPPADLLKENNITEIILDNQDEKILWLKINNQNTLESYFYTATIMAK